MLCDGIQIFPSLTLQTSTSPSSPVSFSHPKTVTCTIGSHYLRENSPQTTVILGVNFLVPEKLL